MYVNSFIEELTKLMCPVKQAACYRKWRLTEIKQADVFIPVGGPEAERGEARLLWLQPVLLNRVGLQPLQVEEMISFLWAHIENPTMKNNKHQKAQKVFTSHENPYFCHITSIPKAFLSGFCVTIFARHYIGLQCECLQRSRGKNHCVGRQSLNNLYQFSREDDQLLCFCHYVGAPPTNKKRDCF